MPNYKGHLAGGAAAFGITFAFTYSFCPSLITAFEWLGCSLAGSLFPDIDIKSKGQKYFYRALLILFLFLIFSQRTYVLTMVSVLALTPMVAKHRGLFHRLWFIIVLPLIVWAITVYNLPYLTLPLLFDTIFFITGAISHLWLDLGFKRMLRW